MTGWCFGLGSCGFRTGSEGRKVCTSMFKLCTYNATRCQLLEVQLESSSTKTVAIRLQEYFFKLASYCMKKPASYWEGWATSRRGAHVCGKPRTQAQMGYHRGPGTRDNASGLRPTPEACWASSGRQLTWLLQS